MSVASTASHQPAPLTDRRILVIEDEYFLADDIGKALRALGAEIAGPVGEIEDAARILQNGSALDAAVLDVNIRNERIFPIARELRARQLPFVFTTGYDKVSIEPEFHDVPLWEKPFDIAAMAQSLAKLVDDRRSEQMRESEPSGHRQA